MTLFQVDAEIGGVKNIIFIEADSIPSCIQKTQDQYGLSTVITKIAEAQDGGKTLV